MNVIKFELLKLRSKSRGWLGPILVFILIMVAWRSPPKADSGWWSLSGQSPPWPRASRRSPAPFAPWAQPDRGLMHRLQAPSARPVRRLV